MSKFFLNVVLLGALVQFCNGQFNSTCRGTLPNVITPAHFFDVDRMMGNWFLHTTWFNNPDAPKTQCHIMELQRGDGPKDINAVESYFNLTSGTDMSLGSSIVIDSTLPLESIWATFAEGVKVAELVWVQTTYDDWSMMYGCNPDTSLEYLVLWLRNPMRKIDEHTYEILKIVAKGYGFPPEFIEPIDNSNC